MAKKDDERLPAADAAEAPGEEAQLQPEPEARRRSFVGTGFYWPVVAGLVLAVAVLVLIVQNTDPVRLQWLWLEVEAPLVVIVLVTFLATALLTEVFGWSYRRRRRRVLSDREELRDLRRR